MCPEHEHVTPNCFSNFHILIGCSLSILLQNCLLKLVIYLYLILICKGYELLTWLMAFHEGLLESCKKSGAEAMKVCEQDPPKSGVDLEGA